MSDETASPSSDPDDAASLRADILSTFRCPLDDGCFHYFSYIPGPSTFSDCPFGHSDFQIARIVGEKKPHLRPIPEYFCRNSLTSNCPNKTTTVRTNENEAEEGNGAEPVIVKCLAGFHPTLEDLVDLDGFNSRLANTVLSLNLKANLNIVAQDGDKAENPPVNDGEEIENKSDTGNIESSLAVQPRQTECCVCYEPINTQVTPYGLLQDCPHVFCSSCIIQWSTLGPQKKCPMCRVYSERILIWPQIVSEPQEKKRLFDLQCKAIGIHIRNHPTSLDRRSIEATFGVATVREQIYAQLVPDASRQWAAQPRTAPVNRVGDAPVGRYMARISANPSRYLPNYLGNNNNTHFAHPSVWFASNYPNVHSPPVYNMDNFNTQQPSVQMQNPNQYQPQLQQMVHRNPTVPVSPPSRQGTTAPFSWTDPPSQGTGAAFGINWTDPLAATTSSNSAFPPYHHPRNPVNYDAWSTAGNAGSPPNQLFQQFSQQSPYQPPNHRRI